MGTSKLIVVSYSYRAYASIEYNYTVTVSPCKGITVGMCRRENPAVIELDLLYCYIIQIHIEKQQDKREEVHEYIPDLEYCAECYFNLCLMDILPFSAVALPLNQASLNVFTYTFDFMNWPFTEWKTHPELKVLWKDYDQPAIVRTNIFINNKSISKTETNIIDAHMYTSSLPIHTDSGDMEAAAKFFHVYHSHINMISGPDIILLYDLLDQKRRSKSEVQSSLFMNSFFRSRYSKYALYDDDFSVLTDTYEVNGAKYSYSNLMMIYRPDIISMISSIHIIRRLHSCPSLSNVQVTNFLCSLFHGRYFPLDQSLYPRSLNTSLAIKLKFADDRSDPRHMYK